MLLLRGFETERGVYLLSEYIGGGELYSAIRSTDSVLSRWQAMFYIGSLVVALEALERAHVVHRDLKPENVMLDDTGYVRLIDFGTARQVLPDGGRTFTKVGTPHYMAPEVMDGASGYGHSVDIWALGVVLFELVCGYLPFGDDLMQPSEIFKAVKEAELKIPAELDDEYSEVLIRGLLERAHARRLGCGHAGVAVLKCSPFFNIQKFQANASASSVHCHPANEEYFQLLLSRRLSGPLALHAAPARKSSRRPSKDTASTRHVVTEATPIDGDEDLLWEDY